MFIKQSEKKLLQVQSLFCQPLKCFLWTNKPNDWFDHSWRFRSLKVCFSYFYLSSNVWSSLYWLLSIQNVFRFLDQRGRCLCTEYGIQIRCTNIASPKANFWLLLTIDYWPIICLCWELTTNNITNDPFSSYSKYFFVDFAFKLDDWTMFKRSI